MGIGNWVKIGGRAWNVRVLSIKEEFSKLYTENTGRTMDVGAPLTLDPLGTFFSHTVEFGRPSTGTDEYDILYEYLAKPRYDGIDVELVHGQTTISYKAYVSSGSRDIKRIDDKTKRVTWEKFQAKFIPVAAQVTPTV